MAVLENDMRADDRVSHAVADNHSECRGDSLVGMLLVPHSGLDGAP